MLVLGFWTLFHHSENTTFWKRFLKCAAYGLPPIPGQNPESK